MNNIEDICASNIFIGGTTLLFIISEVLPFIDTVKSNGLVHSIFNLLKKKRVPEQDLEQGFRTNQYVDVFYREI